MNRQKWIAIMKKIFILPPVPTVLVALPSFLLVFYVLIKKNVNPALTYVAYILSAYALIITIAGIVNFVKWADRALTEHPVVTKILGQPMVERFFSETAFRTEVSLYPSLLINLLYAGIKFYSGIRYASVWFGTLAVYYLLLAIMRFSLLYHVRRKREHKDWISELKICRSCGIILLILDWALTGMIVLVVSKNSGFEYPGMLIYAMALYAFYAVITAVANVIKFRKYENPIVSVTKVINLTAAFVSMLSLETAMLTQFGETRDTAFRQRMTAATGICVSILVLGMAVYIIIQATNQIRKRSDVQKQEEKS